MTEEKKLSPKERHDLINQKLMRLKSWQMTVFYWLRPRMLKPIKMLS